ncbi:MAG: tyrosine-type recombinase/integrase, partial [Actinomycetota bacterium]|nr:tyrosine-type recombinase/integrase [Actinomycetota bacterium]
TVAGTPLDPNNVRRRMLKPLAEEAGASWAGFHTLRHTFASLQLAAGVNVVQLSRALGHHSASFTLDTYVHLLEGESAPALDLAAQLDGANNGATHATETGRTPS